MSILAGTKITQEIERGRIFVDPFEPKHINPASLDLTLGSKVSVYKKWTSLIGADTWDRDLLGPYDGSTLQVTTMDALDVRREKHETREFEIDPKKGWLINPGVGYLMHTHERVRTDHYVPIIDGKSSVGRLFVSIHETAGFGDPGFDGQYTLEVTSRFPVRFYPGMRICQIRFHKIEGTPTLYNGHYTKERAAGPVSSAIRSSAFPKEAVPSDFDDKEEAKTNPFNGGRL
jgi:dCTP deaminase